MRLRHILNLGIGLSLSLLTTVVHAQGVNTVSWNPATTASAIAGTGSGTLDGSSTTVSYQTIPGGLGNAAFTLTDNFDTSLATDGAVGTGVSNASAGVFGTIPGYTTAQTISFSAPVTNPILYVNFGDVPISMDFGGLSLTFLDSNNALLSGSTVTFPGSTNSSNDGFAARINGTFGPGTPISFIYTTTRTDTPPTNFDSVAFTVGVPASAVPEFSSLAAFSSLILPGMLIMKRRNRK